MPPATMTTSQFSASSTGQALPKGPRTPMVCPGLQAASVLVTEPTSRIVWTRRSGAAGLPLMLIATSPAPKA